VEEEDTEEDASDTEGSYHRSPKKKTSSPVKKAHSKKSTSKSSKDKSTESDEEGEFDFLDDINSSGDKLSSGNLASIKQYFGHKGGSSTASANVKTSKKSKVSKFVSSKHTTGKDSGSVNKHNNKHRHSGGGYSSGDNSDTDLEEGGYGNSARYDQDYGMYFCYSHAVLFTCMLKRCEIFVAYHVIVLTSVTFLLLISF